MEKHKFIGDVLIVIFSILLFAFVNGSLAYIYLDNIFEFGYWNWIKISVFLINLIYDGILVYKVRNKKEK